MQLIFSLLAGLIITVALQLLLTSLGAALGLTALNFLPAPKTDSDAPSPPSTSSDFSLPITHLVGFGIALSLTTVLSCASLAVTEFSQIDDPRRGSIFSVILWSSYWLLLIWLSSTTITSIADSFIGAAAGGSKRLFSALRSTSKSNDRPTSESTILKELRSDIAEISKNQAQFPEVLADQHETLLTAIQQSIVPAQSSTTSIQSPPDRSASSINLTTDNTAKGFSAPSSTGAISTLKTALSEAVSQFDLPSWQSLLKQGLNQWDWTDWDIETLWHQLQTFTPQNSPQTFQDAILQDAETYIRTAPTWAFQPQLLEVDFYDRLYDPDADPTAIKTQLAKLSRTHLLDWLKTRDDLKPNQLESLSNHLIEIRDRALKNLSSLAVESAQIEPAQIEIKYMPEIQKKLIAYCRYTNRDALTREGMAEKVQTLIETYSSVDQILPPIDQALDLQAIKTILSKRRGISPKQSQQLIESLKATWPEPGHLDRSPQTPNVWEQLPSSLAERLNKIDPSRLSLEELKPVLTEILNLSEGDGISSVDWTAISQQLQISPDLQDELITWLQNKGIQLAKLPRPWVLRTIHSSQDLYQQLQQQLVTYLKHQDKSAFTPEQITRDLGHVMKGTLRSLPALPNLSDLSTTFKPSSHDIWKQALEQRQDLTSTEISAILTWSESSWQTALEGTNNLLETLVTTLSDSRPTLKSPMESPEKLLNQVRHRVGSPLEMIQDTIEQQTKNVTTEFQRQAKAAQKQAQIAAWWLFISLLGSGIGAGIAGWIAVIY